MNDLIEFFTSKEIIVVYIVFGVACLLCFLVYLLDKSYYKRRQKQNTKELNRLVEQVSEKLEEESVKTEAVPVSAIKNEVVTENVLYVEEPKKVEADAAPVVQAEVVQTPEVATATSEVITKEVEPVAAPVEQKVEVQQIEVPEEKKETVEDLILGNMNEAEKVESLEEEKEVVEELQEDASNELTYVPIEPDQTQAQAALQKLTEELEKAEEITNNITLTSFEEQQEQDAIISLDELLKKSKDMYQANEISQYEDEGDEPISIADLEKRYKEQSAVVEEMIEEKPQTTEEKVDILYVDNDEVKEVVQEKLVLEDFNNVKVDNIKPVETTKVSTWSETKKFKSSPVISPIFGIESGDIQTSMELENTANYEKLDEEIKKTNEFIMTLKELQKKLD